MKVEVKRVYEEPSDDDGFRVLVDRLWPRGVSKQAGRINAWLKDVAPSDELRKWFHERPSQWVAFRRKYLKELTAPEAEAALIQLYDFADQNRKLTLLYASRNTEQNNATVLKELMAGSPKPPTGTGPVKAVASSLRARAGVRR